MHSQIIRRPTLDLNLKKIPKFICITGTNAFTEAVKKRDAKCGVITFSSVAISRSLTVPCLQCFDAAGWAAGRASGL